MNKCGRITVNNKENVWTECNDNAKWLSPNRLRAIGRLKVCGYHKVGMALEFKRAGVLTPFTLLTD